MPLKIRLTCKETTRLVLQGEDRALALGDRLLVRLHLGYCKGCTRFSNQVRLMRGAMDGWRRYADSDASDTTRPPAP